MNNNQKTLIILTPAFPANEQDSVWVPPKQLFVKKLKENFPGLNIIVLSFNYPFHQQTYSLFNVQVTAFNGLKKRKLNRLLLWNSVWKKLNELRKENTIAGILSFWCGECALVGRYFAKRHKLNYFCWISGLDATKDNRLIKFIRPQGKELVAMSEFLYKEFYTTHHKKPQHIIPIGIDPAEFTQPPVERDIDILGVGSFNPFKQYDVFIRIVKKLSLTFPSIKAVICGAGTEKENLQQLITELQLENNITLAGVKPHAEVLQWMQRAKIFIHPSAYEGFGAVCLEALYAGAEVISFCDPMELKIPKWHIVKTTEEMTNKAHELMNHPRQDYSPVLLYSMSDSTKAMMKLFGIENNHLS